MTTVEHVTRDTLWAAARARVEEILPRGRPGMRSEGMFTADGRAASAVVHVVQPDGTRLVYQVIARDTSRGVEVSTGGPWVDNGDAFWADVAADAATVVVGDTAYAVSPDDPDRGWCGFGGAEFHLRNLLTGEVTITRNLWHRGTVPPVWRDRLRPTHEITGSDR